MEQEQPKKKMQVLVTDDSAFAAIQELMAELDIDCQVMTDGPFVFKNNYMDLGSEPLLIESIKDEPDHLWYKKHFGKGKKSPRY